MLVVVAMKWRDMRFLLFTIFVACLVCGCDVYKPVPSLSDNEIIGKWVITEDM